MIISGNKLYNNNKSNIRFSLKVYNLITFKVILCRRFLKIYININNNKSVLCQPLLILFLMTDFSYVWESNLIHSIQKIYYKLSQLIVYILIICCHLNITNILTLSGYSIYEQWEGIINKSISFYIQYTIKLAWIWFSCPSAISNYH